MGTNRKYKTQDLYEAAALFATGEKMIGIETDRKPYKFVFDDFEVCKAKSLEYMNGELAVIAKTYADAVKLLKSRVNTM